MNLFKKIIHWLSGGGEYDLSLHDARIKAIIDGQTARMLEGS
jgi:hypothetical protein